MKAAKIIFHMVAVFTLIAMDNMCTNVSAYSIPMRAIVVALIFCHGTAFWVHALTLVCEVKE